MDKKINIGVTGIGSLIGQAIIKSIKRSDLNEKVDIIGFDYFEDTVGAFWVKQKHILPDILLPHVSEEHWLHTIINVLKENEIKLLFVGVDFELGLFAKYKKLIEERTSTIVMVSSEEVVAIADDKYLTYKFLKDQGLYFPNSYLPGEIDLAKLSYPVIIKPRKGARSVGVYKVSNQQQLSSLLDKVKDPVIQELVGTEEDEYTCGTIFVNNELKKLIVLNRSLKGGNTFISHYKNSFPPIISEYLRDVTSYLKPFGACNFQLRMDKNGKPKIFEINSRHSGTTYIRSLFGFKEVEYLINLLLFNKEISFQLTEGTVVRYYDEFFVPVK